MSTEEKKRGRKPSKDPYFGHVEETAVKEFLSLGGLVEDPNGFILFYFLGVSGIVSPLPTCYYWITAR